MTGQALSKYASVVLTVIHHRLKYDLPRSIRNDLVNACQLSDKTISSYTRELKKKGRLAVTRHPGQRNEYEILQPPTKRDLVITLRHLGLSLDLPELPLSPQEQSYVESRNEYLALLED